MDKMQKAEVDLTNQLGMAVYWYQNSGEKDALYKQGFNSAKKYFDEVKVAKGKKKAVVVDIDETVVDNSEHGAYQFVENKMYDSKVWKKWVEAKRAIATFGAVEYNHYVNDNGGTMFFVSNRTKSYGVAPTIENLIALGFKNVNENTLLLKSNTSKKEARYKEIESMGYEIVQIIGDNLNDFTDATYHKSNTDRKQWVKEHANELGSKYIMLSNPLYGGFDSHGNAQEQLKQRQDAIKLSDWYK